MLLVLILLHLVVQRFFIIPACGLSITVTTTDATTYGASDGTASISVSGGFGSVTLDLNNMQILRHYQQAHTLLLLQMVLVVLLQRHM